MTLESAGGSNPVSVAKDQIKSKLLTAEEATIKTPQSIHPESVYASGEVEKRNSHEEKSIPPSLPPGRSKKADFLEQTFKTWQQHSLRALSREDGREITENIVGFFRILQEWEVKGKSN